MSNVYPTKATGQSSCNYIFASFMERKKKCKNFLFESISVDKHFGQLMTNIVARGINNHVIKQVAS